MKRAHNIVLVQSNQQINKLANRNADTNYRNRSTHSKTGNGPARKLTLGGVHVNFGETRPGAGPRETRDLEARGRVERPHTF